MDGMSRAAAAGAEFVAQMDSDMSHRPEYLPQMLGTLLSVDADVVIGSRYVMGASVGTEWPWYREKLSSICKHVCATATANGNPGCDWGYKLWRTSALEALGLQGIRSNGYSFQVEMNYRSIRQGLKVIELPIHFSTGPRASPR